MLREEAAHFSYSTLELGDVVYSDEEEKFKSEFASLLPDIHRYIDAVTKDMFSGTR